MFRHPICEALIAGALALSAVGIDTASASTDLRFTDLDVSTLAWDESSAQASGSVTGFVLNSGDVATPAGVMVVIFEDRNGDGVFEAAWDLEIDGVAIPPIGAGASYPFTDAIVADLAFRDSPISVMVDAGNLIVETDETNNVVRSNFGCTRTPSPGPLDPQVQWQFVPSGGDPYADYLNVTAAPAVADLDGDGMPEIVVGMTNLSTASASMSGILRVLNGEDGSLDFQVTSVAPGQRFNVNVAPAIGDIDGDGKPEIIACGDSNNNLVCIGYGGVVKWISPGPIEPLNRGAPAIADLDGDGTPEIIMGRQLLQSDGSLSWTGTSGRGGPGVYGPISCPADVDMDGQLEIVAGNTIYRPDGSLFASNTQVPDGWVAVADLDLDGTAEVVHVSGGMVRAFDGLTMETDWGPVAMPGSGGGGPPTIADFDGDGYPEVAVSGRDRFVVFEPDGSVRWSAPIFDPTSGLTACSAFDFDADGAAEAIARDENNVFVFSGMDGSVLLQLPLSSCTFLEFAFAADVDADGRAEIVAGANNVCGGGTDRSLYVFESAADHWPATRRVWNEHGYHVTNTNEDATIPRYERPHWLAQNSYRQSWLTVSPSPWGGLDLTGSRLRLECAPESHVLTLRVGNAGQLGARPGIPVTFYAGDPSGGGTLLQTVHTQTAIVPGGWEDVSASFDAANGPAGDIHAVVDDAGGLSGTQSECDETNNVVARSLSCPALAVQDGAIQPECVRLEAGQPNPFTTRTAIRFVIGRRAAVTMEILDADGRRVRTLWVGAADAGRHVRTWDGRDDGGRHVAPGVYYCRLRANDMATSRRLVRLD